MKIINYVIKVLGINTQLIFSSELNIQENGSNKILGLCKALDCDVYLSGSSGKNYLNVDDFTKNDITIQFQNFQYPIYRQLGTTFMPNLSILDLLFNEGDKSRDILLKSSNF